MKKESKVVLSILEAMEARLECKIDVKPLYSDLDDILNKVFRANGYSEQEIQSIKEEVDGCLQQSTSFLMIA